MSLEQIIHNDTFTDSNGEIHYLNTGRDNISGLSFPNHYVRNKNNYKYTRILNMKLSQDTSLVYPIHQCFLLTTYKNNDSKGITNLVNVDGIVRDGTIKTPDLSVTCTPLNYISNISDIMIHDITATLINEVDNGNTVISLGLWLNTADIIDILVKDLSSLAYNEIPNNIIHQFLECDYEAYYLDNEDVMYEINMFNLINSIGTIVTTGKNNNEALVNKVKNIDTSVQTAVPDYQYLTVIYDDLYTITDIDTDEIIRPTAFQYVEVGNSFATINDNYLKVNQEGNYIIALKINMDIHDGNPSKFTMSLFLNDDRVEETTTTLYLDPANKVHPLGFLAGQARMQLKPSDKLYLKVRWTDKENVNIENHCTLQVIKLNNIK